MADLTKGWAWFERQSPETDGAPDGADPAAAELPDAGREVRQAFSRCLSGPDGDKVLAHLRSLTLERALGPDASSAMLRHTEGQRQLVRYITQQVERGRSSA